VRIERLVVRVPQGALGAGSEKAAARQYGRRLAEALLAELGTRPGASGALGSLQIRSTAGTDPSTVARHVATSLRAIRARPGGSR
jgi:hypothetical protein